MPKSTNVLTPVLLAILLTVIASTVALMAKSTAAGYLSNLNLEHPELAKHAPILGFAPQRTSRRVILIIVDGLRLQDSFGRPTMGRLRRAGIDTTAQSHYPTISRPNHTALVTGVPPLASGVRNNTYRSPVLIDSIMDRLQAEGREATFIADVSPSLAYLFSDDFAAMYYGNWTGAVAKSTQLALARGQSDLLVIIPGAVDTAGHDHGGDSLQYRNAVTEVDRILAQSLVNVDLSLDTIIITADHGHTDDGGHGGEEESVMRVPLILAGAGIVPDALLGKVDLIDVAPTIAALLGIPAPGHALGRSLSEVLTISAADKEQLRRSDRLRIERNTKIYKESLAQARTHSQSTKRNRFFLLSGLFAVAILLLWGARKVGALVVDWRVLLIAVPAYPLCYYGLLDLLGQSLSFSALQDQGSEMSNLMRFGLIATAVQVLAGWLVLQNRVVLRDRLAAANALVLFGLLVAWIPAALLWALHGDAPHVEIPGSTVALLIPANYIAVSTYAVGATLLLVLEIIVFFARAVDPRVRIRRLERAALRERNRLLIEEKENE
ncbi:MAG: alkaline phosphatase family protein [Kofleriaceae bacterium]|nr:alkaline phosphatase family protein [Kofleriaceae bacterium]